MSGSALDVLSRALCAARRSPHRIAPPDIDLLRLSQADGYAVQKRVARELGWFPDGHPCAWKLGGSPKTGPTTAPVPDNAVFGAPWRVPADFAVGYGIEAELAVRLAHDLPADVSAAEIWQAIDTFHPCVELCDMRLEATQPLPVAVQLADQQLNRALIVGPGVALATPPVWQQTRVQVLADGRCVHDSLGGHPYGDPLNSLAWLARHAHREWDGLHAGDIIATGSWSGLYWAQAGETIHIDFSGFGVTDLVIEG